MADRISVTARNASADATVDLLDAGTGAGKLRIYSGSQPATPETAASGTLLAEIAFADPAFGAASSGVASVASAPRSGTGVAAGDAGWFRTLDSDNNAVWDGAVTATGGGGELELVNVNIAIGQPVNVLTLTYTQPGS